MPLKPPGPEALLPVCEGHYHSQEQTQSSSGPMPTKPVRPQPLYWGHSPAAPASGPPGDSGRSRLFLPKELPDLLAGPQSTSLLQAPTCWPERHSLCRPGLGPWAPSSLDLGCKSTSLFWAPGHSAGDCRVPGAQLAIGLHPSYLQDPPSPTAPCGLRWLLQLPT